MKIVLRILRKNNMSQNMSFNLNYTLNVKRISQDHVWSNDKVLYNVNNLWIDDKAPDDYDEVLSRGRTKNWISKDVPFIELDKSDTSWMVKHSTQIGAITGRFSKIYESELENTLSKHSKNFPEGEWFIRTEQVSLKEGCHGIGPYNNLKHVIESIVSSRLGHLCISPKDDLEHFKIYFLDWKKIFQEYRVFVYQNKITCLCGQHLYSIDSYLSSLSDEQIKTQITDKILLYFESSLKDRLSNIVGPNYTMDIAILEDGSVYFIEPNSFGAEYAAGSALYHWIYDKDVIYNDENDSIEFRFVDRE